MAIYSEQSILFSHNQRSCWCDNKATVTDSSKSSLTLCGLPPRSPNSQNPAENETGVIAYTAYTLFLCDFLSQNKQNQISQTKIRVASTLLFILAGCILFVTIPAVIFKHIEGWTALESTYFVVITLTTVGIGDYVAGESLSFKVKIFIHGNAWPVFFLAYD